MSLPSNIAFSWPGAAAAIPAGWQRVSELDGKHVFIISSGSRSTGGAATHVHTEAAHTHQVSLSGYQAAAGATNTVIPKGRDASTNTHAHAVTTSVSAIGTIQPADNAPLYLAAIWIRPSDLNREGVPSGACGFWDNINLPAGFSLLATAHHRFLKGAVTGADGGTTGGSETHGHTCDSHAHAIGYSSTSPDSLLNRPYTSNDWALKTHRHPIYLDASTGTIQSASSLPAFESMHVLQNTGVSESLPEGIMGLWLGTAGDVSSGWVIRPLASEGDFIRATSTGAELGTAGGSRTHAHTADSHIHVGNCDPEDGPTWGGEGTVPDPTVYFAAISHSHGTVTVDSTTPTVNSSSADPAWSSVFLIKYILPISISLGLAGAVAIARQIIVEALPLAAIPMGLASAGVAALTCGWKRLALLADRCIIAEEDRVQDVSFDDRESEVPGPE